MSVLTSRWLLSFRQLAMSVWNDSQTIPTDPSTTGRPTTTMDTITHSFGFSTWTTEQENIEIDQLEPSLQKPGDERVDQ